MPVSADVICRSGVSYPVAIEIARQINAGPGGIDATSANKLVACGIPPQAAKELLAQITAGSFSDDKLAKAGFHPEASIHIKKQSGL